MTMNNGGSGGGAAASAPGNPGGRSKWVTIGVTGLALFAMYFGAGNLILPVMIGVEGGTAGTVVTFGFVLTGVLLPVLAMVAAATSEHGLEGVAARIGRVPGLIYCWIAMLTTGVLYAVPRVATVSFDMSAGAIGNLPDKPGSLGLLVYSFIFLLVTALFVWNPTGVIDKIGKWLTPALLILMVVMIVAALVQLTPVMHTPAEKYAGTPFVSGLLVGYNTLDAIASLVFGAIIIDSLRGHGVPAGKPIFRATISSGAIAGVLLALVYFGLAAIGTRIGDSGVDNGATGLAYAANLLFAGPGQWVLAIIAILACLTTAVGLIGASVAFFSAQFPRVPRIVMLTIHMVIAFAIANLGLVMLMTVVVPMMYFCYPITIALVIVTIIDIFVPGHLYWSYRLSVAVAAVFGLIDAVVQGFEIAQVATPGWFDTLVSAIPLADLSLGWAVPVLIVLVIGLVVDGVTKKSFDRASIEG